MPHNLHSVYTHFAMLHDGDKVSTETLGIGKSQQEVTTFGDQVLLGHGTHDVEKLKMAEAKEFERFVGQSGLTLKEDIDERSKTGKGNTALTEAVEQNLWSYFLVLLDHGANPLVENAEGNNSIMRAAELGRNEMLEEFGKMIKGDAKPEQMKGQEKKIDAPAARMDHQGTEKSEIQAEPKSQPPKSNHKGGTRVAITAADLKRPNKYGKSVNTVLSESVKKSEEARKAHQKEQDEKHYHASSHADAGAHFKAMIDRLKAANHMLSSVAKKKETETGGSAPVDNSKEDVSRYLEKVKTYEATLNQFMDKFEETRNEIKLINGSDKVSYPALNAFVDQAKDRAKHVLLPYDRGLIAGVLTLIHNFSRVSFSGFFEKYRGDANKLVAHYVQADGVGKTTFTQVKDVVAFYQRLSDEYKKVKEEFHHGQVKNDAFNSEYCRILKVSLEHLEKTAIIGLSLQASNKTLMVRYEDYLDANRHRLQTGLRAGI